MKGKVRIIVLLILIQSCCFCQNKPHPDIIDLISLAKAQERNVYAHEVFDSLSVLHPSNVIEGMIGRVMKSYVYKDFLIVASRDYVQVFDLKGNFIFRTSKGKGPNEVQQISDFTVDYDNDELLVLDVIGKKVVRVKFNGQYHGVHEVKRGSMSLCYLGSNKTCYYVPYNYYQENGKLYDYFYIQDYEGVTYYTKKLKRETVDSHFVTMQFFRPFNNGCTFKPQYSDTVLFINREGFHNYKVFDYRGTQMPEKYAGNIDLRREFAHEYLGSSDAVFTPSYTFYYLEVKGGYLYLFVYDEKNKSAIKSKSGLNGLGLILGGSSSEMRVMPQFVNYDGSFLLVCDITDINKYVLGQEGSSEYYKSLFESLKKLDPGNDNPVFLKGYIKN